MDLKECIEFINKFGNKFAKKSLGRFSYVDKYY